MALMTRHVRFLYETEEEDYYEPVKISNAFDDHFVKYESNVGKDKTLSI